MLIRLAISLLILLCAVPAFADTHAAADCAQATVAAAVAAATAGDTVTIPACEATTWDDPVTIDKNLTISGDSPTTTTLRTNDEASEAADGIFTIADNVVVYIKNIGFTPVTPVDTNAYNAPIWFAGDTHSGSVIYNCKFDGHKWAIFAWDGIGIVVSKNSFIDGGVQLYGLAGVWGEAAGVGGDNFAFIEGNTFVPQRGEVVHFVLGYSNSKYVFRYNDVSSVDATHDVSGAIDAHGYGHGSGTTLGRSTRAWEIYNNSFTTNGTETAALQLRGGSGVVYKNLFNQINNAYNSGEILLWEYRQYADILSGPTGGTSAGCGTPTSAVTGYCSAVEGEPCCDAVGRGVDQAADPAYIWLNYKCTTAPCLSNLTAINATVSADSTTYLEAGEDFFNSEKSGYAPKACVHPSVTDLSGKSCDTTIYGSTGYGIDSAHTVTPSVASGSGTLSPGLPETISNGGNSSTYTATPANGWKVTWSGTCGATGSASTYQKTGVDADCTVIATFTEIKLMPW